MPEYLPLGEALDRCQSALIAQEGTIVSFPDIDWSRAKLSMKEQVDLRRFLRAKEHFLANQDRVFELWVTALCNVFGGIIADLPSIPDDDSPTLTVPLYSLFARFGRSGGQNHRHVLRGASRQRWPFYRIPKRDRTKISVASPKSSRMRRPSVRSCTHATANCRPMS